MTTNRISYAVIEQLKQLGAATVYEAQGALGALDHGIKPVDPTSRLAGPAFTVDMRPADNLMLHYALLKAQPGDVLVVDAKAFMEAAPWGDVLTAQAMKLGLAGLVINGTVRDGNAIIESGFPVFCRGLSIKGTGKHQPGRVNVPIMIGDTVINPDDIVIGDRDGVVVVPKESVDAVIKDSIAREEKEAAMKEAIMGGATTAELMGLTARLQRLGLE